MSAFTGTIQFSDSNPPQLILAGDPQQLGPVVHSTSATAGGLGVSYLERLINEADVYSPQV